MCGECCVAVGFFEMLETLTTLEVKHLIEQMGMSDEMPKANKHGSKRKCGPGNLVQQAMEQNGE